MLLTVRWPLCPPREPVTMFAHREHTVVFWTLLLQQPCWGGACTVTKAPVELQPPPLSMYLTPLPVKYTVIQNPL